MDKEFYIILSSVLKNDAYKLMKYESCHGTNKYDHMIRVAYKSFVYAKKKGLAYISITRGALLHDFAFNQQMDNDGLTKRKKLSKHPEYALNTSLNYFYLNDIEKDIIISHMFPIGKRIPRYKESYIVSYYDKKIALNEFKTYKWRFKESKKNM